MTIPSRKERAAMTPMMQQYFDLKEQAPGAVLFFRMGDFYEVFGTDAEEVAPKLQLVLTSRERGDQTKIPFCGVPHHSARGYWLKLIKAGYKIALADQVEDPAEAKGLVRREIVRILSPGCIDDPEGLDATSPNYLLSLYEDPQSSSWAVAISDLSTGEFRLGNALTEQAVVAFVERYRPKELLCRRFYMEHLRGLLSSYMAQEPILIEALPESPLRDRQEQRFYLDLVLNDKSLDSQPCGMVQGGAELFAATMAHIKGMNLSLSQFLTIRPLVDPATMCLDETAVRDLELFETALRRQQEGSLFKELNHTCSPMGARLFRHNLGHPLLEKAKIKLRQDALQALLDLGETQLQRMRDSLRSPDLERLVTRLITGAVTPAELASIRDQLRRIDYLIDSLAILALNDDSLLASVNNKLRSFTKPLALLDEALMAEPGPLGSGAKVFREGYCHDFDAKRRLAENGAEEVSRYESQLRERTGISSLKIKQHKNFGLLIEVTKSNLSRVPDDFIRRQTMVNCERFITFEVKELSERLASATEECVAQEALLYQNLMQKLVELKRELRQVASGIAMLDMLQSFTWQALKQNYVRPQFSDDKAVVLKGSRHPVVERFVGKHAFVANDITIDYQRRHLLITGPNMAGKSTFMRQMALASIMHQIGAFIPALEAKLPVFDRIFTRVGASDDLTRGQSTFMVEMTEAARILRQATADSLVILDEVGRGTSTQDGLAIAAAILETLAQKTGCYTLFATHYHELVPFADSLKTVCCVRTEVLRESGEIKFTHRLLEGASSSSFGIEVAKLAGVPKEVIDRAQSLLKLSHPPKPHRESLQLSPGGSREHAKLPLEEVFDQAVAVGASPRLLELADKITDVKIHRMTPLQALNFLNELKDAMTAGEQPSLFND